MTSALIVATAWSSYNDSDFANKMFVRYQGRVIHERRVILVFRTGLDAFRIGLPVNKLLNIISWAGLEPRRGELLHASRGQQNGKVVINFERTATPPRPTHPVLAPQVSITIFNIAAPPSVQATIENVAPAPPVNAAQRHASLVADSQPTADTVPTPTRHNNVIDLTWISDTEEDMKPTVHKPEQRHEPSGSASLRPIQPKIKPPGCPSREEIRRMVQYIAEKPAGADMADPEQWTTFNPRRSIYGWAKIYIKREAEIKHSVNEARKNMRKTKIVVKQEH